MSNLKIVLNTLGVRELLKSGEMMSICKEHAEAVRKKCGDGYTTSSYVGMNRANVSVTAETSEAKRDNSQNNTILKAVSGS